MRNFILYAASFAAILAAIWLAFQVAGTDWSILYAGVAIVVTLVLMKRSA